MNITIKELRDYAPQLDKAIVRTCNIMYRYGLTQEACRLNNTWYNETTVEVFFKDWCSITFDDGMLKHEKSAVIRSARALRKYLFTTYDAMVASREAQAQAAIDAAWNEANMRCDAAWAERRLLHARYIIGQRDMGAGI